MVWLTQLLVPIVAISIVPFMVVTIFFLRYKERRLLIENNVAPEVIKALMERKRKRRSSLGIGIILVCFGLGFAIGDILSDITNRDSVKIFFILVGLGTGMIIAHFANEKYEMLRDDKIRQQKQTEEESIRNIISSKIQNNNLSDI